MSGAAKLKKVVILLLVGAVSNVWAGGQAEEGPPQIRTLLEGEAYISPDSSEGTQDSIEIPIEVQAVGRGRVIVAYRLTVLNDSGQVVWLEESIDESPEPGFFARLFTNLGFRSPNTTVEIPEFTEWDGTYKINGPEEHPDDGKLVPDGIYAYVLEATDSEGTTATTAPQTVVVDNIPPTATVVIPAPGIFSPNGDDQRDTLRITQETSTEDLWIGTVTDAGGDQVLSIDWTGQVPSLIVWEGTDLEGEPLEDGVYTYTLTSTDRAGNSFALDPVTAEIDTLERPMTLTTADGVSAFSPNDDGVQDSVTIAFEDGVADGLLQSSVTIRNESGSIVRSWQSVQVPGSMEFNGTDLNGAPLPEGEYQVSAVARYNNGTVVRPDPIVITLDTTPPTAGLRAEFDIFSPEGDGRKDSVAITQQAESGAQWQGIVRDGSGTLVATLNWGATVPTPVEWDGTDLDGELVEDGTYRYQLIGIDAGGNQGTSNEISVVVDARETTASLTAGFGAFSPNGDNQRDAMSMQPELSLSTGVERYDLRIFTSEGTLTRTISRTGNLPGMLSWDGSTDVGSQAPEATYRAELEVVYRKGNVVTAETDTFELDRTVPSITLEISNAFFSPNGDGVLDTTRVAGAVTPGSNLESSVVSLVGPQGQEVLRLDDVTDAAVSWDGSLPGGGVVADGTYRVQARVAHRNGTVVEKDANVVVDTVYPDASVDLSATSLVLSGASDQEGITIGQSSSREVLWTGDIYSVETGRVVYTQTWQGQVRPFLWDGTGTAGQVVPAGAYRYRVSSTDRAGNQTEVESPEFALTTDSLIRIAFDGAGLSPNGDNAFETIDLRVDSDDPLDFGGWTLVISNEENSAVRELSGTQLSTPVTIAWDGRGDDGNPVVDGQYSAEITAEYRSGAMGATTPATAVVDTAGPSASLTITGEPFSPDEDGYNDTVLLAINADDISGISRWQMRVVDGRELWRRFVGSTVPASQQWNGATTSTRSFESASELSVEYQVSDGLGNVTTGSEPLQIGVLVDVVDDTRRQIRVSNVLFEGYTTNYINWDEEIAEQNTESLAAIARILSAFPEYSVVLDGHAVSLLYYDEALASREQERVLLPLSEGRSSVIRDALVDRGIDSDRIKMNWFGGSKPIVPFADIEGRWVNRRVEFYLQR